MTETKYLNLFSKFFISWADQSSRSVEPRVCITFSTPLQPIAGLWFYYLLKNRHTMWVFQKIFSTFVA